MNRRHVRYAFLALFVLLPVQYAVVGLAGLQGEEPWPALVLPGFKNVWDDGSRISMPVAVFEIYFDDETIEILEPRTIFAAIPASHHLAVMRRQFCPASVSGSIQTERGNRPETRAWLAARVDELFPGRVPVSIHVEWRRLEVERNEASPRSTPLDTLKIDLL